MSYPIHFAFPGSRIIWSNFHVKGYIRSKITRYSHSKRRISYFFPFYVKTKQEQLKNAIRFTGKRLKQMFFTCYRIRDWGTVIITLEFWLTKLIVIRNKYKRILMSRVKWWLRNPRTTIAILWGILNFDTYAGKTVE